VTDHLRLNSQTLERDAGRANRAGPEHGPL